MMWGSCMAADYDDIFALRGIELATAAADQQQLHLCRLLHNAHAWLQLAVVVVVVRAVGPFDETANAAAGKKVDSGLMWLAILMNMLLLLVM
jgi:hypothetical protein